MNNPIDDPATGPDAPRAADGWQPPPPRARALLVLNMTPLAIPGAIAGYFAADIGGLQPAWPGVLAGIVLGLAFALWLGLKQYRCSAWRHDASGLAVRRGNFWRRETRVPASRVQHLDVKRGPLQRRRDLATLVVHTAGTRNNAVTVGNLDATDAQRLREALSRQIDRDDA